MMASDSKTSSRRRSQKPASAHCQLFVSTKECSLLSVVTDKEDSGVHLDEPLTPGRSNDSSTDNIDSAILLNNAEVVSCSNSSRHSSRHCQLTGCSMTSSNATASGTGSTAVACGKSSAPVYSSRPVSDDRTSCSISTRLHQRCFINNSSTTSPTSPPPSLQQQQQQQQAGGGSRGAADSSNRMVRSVSHSAAMKMTPSSTSLDGGGAGGSVQLRNNTSRYPSGVQSPISPSSTGSSSSGLQQPQPQPKAKFLFCAEDDEVLQAQQPHQQLSPTSCKSPPATGASGSSSTAAGTSGGGGGGSHGGSTKKRFVYKKIIGSLRRSKSAGSTRDVPAHALFLQYDVHAAMHHSKSQSHKFTQSCRGASGSSSVMDSQRSVRSAHNSDSGDDQLQDEEDAVPTLTSPIDKQPSKKKSLAQGLREKFQFLQRRHTDTQLTQQSSSPGGKPTPEIVLSWSRSFETLLTDPNGLESFRQFLRSEFSDENIEFWIACEKFKTVKANKLSPTAEMIFSDYVAVQAPREVNLDSKTRTITEANMDKPDRMAFDVAQKRIQALMEKDSYRRYLQSQAYRDLLGPLRNKLNIV